MNAKLANASLRKLAQGFDRPRGGGILDVLQENPALLYSLLGAAGGGALGGVLGGEGSRGWSALLGTLLGGAAGGIYGGVGGGGVPTYNLQLPWDMEAAPPGGGNLARNLGLGAGALATAVASIRIPALRRLLFKRLWPALPGTRAREIRKHWWRLAHPIRTWRALPQFYPPAGRPPVATPPVATPGVAGPGG